MLYDKVGGADSILRKFSRVATVANRNAFAAMFVFAVFLACGDFGFPESSEVSGTRPLGAPLLLNGEAYGTTASGGPHCRDPFADEVYDGGCGVFYVVDRKGRYSQRYAFRDARLGAPAGALVAGPDGWIYGATTTLEPAKSDAGERATVFRIRADGSGFQVVYRFAEFYGGEQLISIGAVDRGGVIYAITAAANGTPEGLGQFYRIAPGHAKLLAEFPALQNVGPPARLRDGWFAEILRDFGSCSVTGVLIAEDGRVRKLFARANVQKREGRCFEDGIPISSPVSYGTDLLALNSTQLIRVTVNGRRTVIARLPAALGHFVGAPIVERSGDTLALAADAQAKVCLRLIRIGSGGFVSVVHAFDRADHRCLSDTDDVVPRLAVSLDGEVVFTTGAEDGCARPPSNATEIKFGPSCGSVVGVRHDGSLAFVHDFVQRSPVTDTGAPSVRYQVSGKGRSLHVSLARAPPGPQPFDVDLGRFDLRLVGSNGDSSAIRIEGSAHSHRAPQVMPGGHSVEADVADAYFPLPSTLPADMYRIAVTLGDAVHDTKGEQLGVISGMESNLVYVPSASSREVETLRTTYLWAPVAATGRCRDEAGNLVVVSSPSARVVEIERSDASEFFSEFPLGFSGRFAFTSINPVAFTVWDPDAQFGGTFSEPPDRADPNHPKCPEYRVLFADAWQADRAFKPPIIDPSWPARFRRAIDEHKPIIGMTPDMVVAAWGFPSAFGSFERLRTLERWEYDEPPPFGHSVRFRNGRVVSVVLPGNLP